MAQLTLSPTAAPRSASRSFLHDLFVLLELAPDAERATRPRSTRTLDAVYLVLALQMTIGLWLDIWSHSFFGPDQSVLNPFHMLFYGAGAAMGGLLAFLHFSALRRGIRWAHTLPVGYGLGAVGLLIFGVAGVIDLISHALFGFETGFEAILSPSHVGLFVGWFLVGLTPMRAVAGPRGNQPRTLLGWLPGILGMTVALSALFTILMLHNVIGGESYAVQAARMGAEETTGATLQIGGQFLQTGMLAGVLLWLAANFRLPFGAFTLMLGITGALMLITAPEDPAMMPVLLLGGLAADALRFVLRPSADAPLRLRAFGFLFPLALWFIYYGTYIVTNWGGGVWLTPYVWVGSVVQSAFIGLFIAFFMTMQPRAATAEVPHA